MLMSWLRSRLSVAANAIGEIAKPLSEERSLENSRGELGELLVTDALRARGYRVEPTKTNARQSDLLVTSPGGTVFSVEVKCGRSKRPTWWVRQCPDPSASAIWCLVAAPGDPSEDEIFVLK